MSVVVVAHVSHGGYVADFVGAGTSVTEALDKAAVQSTYSEGIVPGRMGNFMAARVPLRQAIISKLEAGLTASDFGWVDFRRIA